MLEFVDVFPTNLLGLHPERDIDLPINLDSSTHSLSKGFIRTIVSL